MENLFKEKSWSVKIVNGFVANDQVRGPHCTDCEGECNLMICNGDNPNLVLFGCNQSKCQHKLIRLHFNDQ